MPLVQSSLSQVCKGIRGYLDGALNAPDRSKVTVVLAAPADTASGGASDSEHRLNLFFYRFEPSGLYPDIQPGETDWLRTFCLVTPFAVEESPVGAGENDLRLVGEVIRIFHEKPVFLLDVDGEEYHLQVIFQPLAVEHLNQIWSTQGDTTYRPSALFEISLAPVVPLVKTVQPPLAGGIGFAVQPAMHGPDSAVADTRPEVPVMAPTVGRPDWAPAIAFVDGGTCAFSLGFVLGSAELAAFTPRVWLAGKGGEQVSLRWETWDTAGGWRTEAAAVTATITDTSIVPAAAATASTTAVTLPFTDHVGQMMLYAERSYIRPGDGAVLAVRSNPLLISLSAA